MYTPVVLRKYLLLSEMIPVVELCLCIIRRVYIDPQNVMFKVDDRGARINSIAAGTVNRNCPLIHILRDIWPRGYHVSHTDSERRALPLWGLGLYVKPKYNMMEDGRPVVLIDRRLATLPKRRGDTVYTHREVDAALAGQELVREALGACLNQYPIMTQDQTAYITMMVSLDM